MSSVNKGLIIFGILLTIGLLAVVIPVYLKRQKTSKNINSNITNTSMTTLTDISMIKSCEFIRASQFTFKNDVGPSKNPWTAHDLNFDHRDEIILIDHIEGDIYICDFERNGSLNRCRDYPGESYLYPVHMVVTDFNNDHRLDIAYSSTMSDSLRILINRGDNTFGKQTIFDTGEDSEPEGFVVTNLNDDEHVDLIVVTSGTNQVMILFGQGNAVFTEHRTYSTEDISDLGWIHIADFDGDSILDLVFWDVYSSIIAIMFGLGNGEFDVPEIFDTHPAKKYSSISIGDLNSDGRSDIVIVSDFESTILVLLGQENKTLTKGFIYDIEEKMPHALGYLALINDDPHLDLVLLLYSIEYLQVFFGLGDGTFRKPMNLVHEPIDHSRELVFGHFDDDNRSDIAVLAFGQATEMHILLNNC